MNTSNNISQSFPVIGMSCKGCLAHVEKAIARQDGVINSSVDLASNQATIEYDPSITSPTTIKQAVVDAGYDLLIGEV